MRLLYDITRRPFTSSSLFLAKDKKSGKKATREKFERLFEKSLFHVNTENVYLRKHPTSIIFMDSVDKDPDRIRGGTYSMIHWSEVAFSRIEHGESIISIFDKVVQPTLSQTDGYVMLESTCNGKNGWWDIWENYKDYGFSRLKVSLSDMVYFGLLAVEEYERIKNTTHPDVFRQEYECEWVSFQGKTYNEFNEATHVRDFPGPEEWQTVISSVDWGYDPSATCVLFGYVKDEILHVFDEHYQHRELAAITAEQIESKKAHWRIKRFVVTADHEEDRNEELRSRGINCGLAKKANVLGARIEIKEAFYFNKILIHPRCTFLRRDLNAAVWDTKKKEGEIDYSQCTWGHFDGEAALRYMMRELSDVEVDEPERNPHRNSSSEVAYDINRMLTSH